MNAIGIGPICARRSGETCPQFKKIAAVTTPIADVFVIDIFAIKVDDVSGIEKTIFGMERHADSETVLDCLRDVEHH